VRYRKVYDALPERMKVKQEINANLLDYTANRVVPIEQGR